MIMKDELKILKDINDTLGVEKFDFKNPFKMKEIGGFILGKELGKGAYAAVKVGVHKETKQRAAVKMYDRMKQNQLKLNIIIREVKNLCQLDHPSIIKVLGYYEGTKYICIIMEFGGSSSLLDIVNKSQHMRMAEDKAKPLIRQVIEALAYCHMKCIYHRDIKLDNILVDESGCIKMIDFGFSEKIAEGQKSTSYCGAPAFFAPEILNKQPFYPEYSDIWAVGVLIYRMIAGFFPFQDEDLHELGRKIAAIQIFYPVYFSESLTNLLKNIFKNPPTSRMTLSEVADL